MDIKYNNLQKQYDLLYSFFKTTTEPFDDIEWDGEVLKIWVECKVIESYTLDDLNEIIPDFSISS